MGWLTNGFADSLVYKLVFGSILTLRNDRTVEHLPSWFPGAGFKKTAQRCVDMMKTVSEVPFTIAKKKLVGHR